MNITIQAVPPAERRPKPKDESKLGFGKVYSDHMLTMEWTSANGWQNPTISKYRALELDPATLVFHYGQTIFEGLKAYRTEKGTINLFRPDQNAERFNRSAARLDMPAIDTADMLEFFRTLVELDRDWVPRTYGTSLYIRPFMIATEPYLGLKSSHQFLFLIITGPVGAYYPEGFNPVKIMVSEKYSRAGPGGLGGVKTAANYAASLLAEKEAVKAGFTQVLWLDASERKYPEEVGSMNIFFKIGGKVITPPVGSTTLPGVTRDSVLQLARHWGIPAEERRISIDEIVAAGDSGTLEEIFGAGTAAVISPVGVLQYKGKDLRPRVLGEDSFAQRLFTELMGIQYGTKPDPFHWVMPLESMGRKAAASARAR